jgi:hypothetical protein
MEQEQLEPMSDTAGAVVGAETKSNIKREEPDVTAQRKNLVSQWLKDIKAAEDFFEPDFKRMRDNMQLAYAGATKKWIEQNNFVVPIISRHINQAVASLYAKNPRVIAEKKRRLDYIVWDGREDSLKAAEEGIALAMSPPIVDPATGMATPPPQPNPEHIAIIKEVSEVQKKNLMLKRVCKTMEVLLHYYMNEQTPSFKKQLKQLVRRTKICGVGYVFLGYQRLLEKRPDIAAKIEDVSAQLARIETLSAELQDGLMEEDSARREELKTMLADLQAKVEVIAREGPVFDFPRSTEIIIDQRCRQLNGLVGAGWFARKMFMKPDEITDIYKIDINNSFRAYKKLTNKSGKESWNVSSDTNSGDADSFACVYEVWNKTNNQTFTVIDGYSDFVRGPETPEVELERFWPLFVLTFNDVEHEEKLYPVSDVQALEHTQMEYNRSRQARRLHRQANKPKYATVAGRLSNADKNKLQTHPDSAIIELNGLSAGEDVNTVLQVMKPAPMDPALYETNSEMEDVFRTVGSQEANLGGSSGATATEVSVGEQSRTSSLDSNVDDLDEMLSELVQATGQMLLLKLEQETVKRIAGPGAVWPQMSRQEIMEEVMIDIKAGSSGRPNRAAELANMERAAPFLMQIDGVKMTPVGSKYADLLDIDVEEMIVEGVPSQTALNAIASKMAQGGMGGAPMAPGAGPTEQGMQGGANAAKPSIQPGAQPAFPAPAPVQ